MVPLGRTTWTGECGRRFSSHEQEEERAREGLETRYNFQMYNPSGLPAPVSSTFLLPKLQKIEPAARDHHEMHDNDRLLIFRPQQFSIVCCKLVERSSQLTQHSSHQNTPHHQNRQKIAESIIFLPQEPENNTCTHAHKHQICIQKD